MKILIVSATYPPEHSAAAGIIYNLIDAFAKNGETVEGLTLKSSLSAPDVIAGEYGRVYYADYVLHFSNGVQSCRDILLKIKKKLAAKINHNCIKLYGEDMVRAFLKRMMSMDMQAYDVILMPCAYYSAAEAVIRYKEKKDCKAKIALYQLDPLLDNAIYQHLPYQERDSFENRLFDRCDRIFTTPIIYESCKSMQNGSKFIPLEFPVVVENTPDSGIESCAQKDEITCVFAGYLYPNIRNPEFLLKLFSLFQDSKLKLYILGTGMEKMLDSYQKGELNGRLIILGLQSGTICQEWLSRADLLVNISNAVSNQVPSKVFQYISLGKPILNVYKCPDCRSLKYLKKYPLAINIYEGDGIDLPKAQAIEKQIMQLIGRRLSSDVILREYETCTPQYVAGRMINEFKSTLKG